MELGRWIWLGSTILTALAVWWDAHVRLGMHYGGPTGRSGALGAPGWVALMLVGWPLALPLYAYRRRQWLDRRP